MNIILHPGHMYMNKDSFRLHPYSAVPYNTTTASVVDHFCGSGSVNDTPGLCDIFVCRNV
jgi:hypothetical protein